MAKQANLQCTLSEFLKTGLLRGLVSGEIKYCHDVKLHRVHKSVALLVMKRAMFILAYLGHLLLQPFNITGSVNT